MSALQPDGAGTIGIQTLLGRIPRWVQLGAAIGGVYNAGCQAWRIFDGRDPESTGVLLGILLTGLALGITVYVLWFEKDEFTRGFVLGAGLVALTGIVLLAVALATVRHTSVKIEDPSRGETIQRTEIVEGSFQKISDNESIWIAVVPLGLEEYRYHPQSAATRLSKGKWQATAFIGLDSPSDAGREFDIHALLVNEKGEAGLLKYLDDSRAAGSFPGLLALPPGVVSYHQVTVVRGGAASTPTATPSRSTITIEWPQDGESVGPQIAVRGRYSGLRTGGPPVLCVLVKPLPDNPEIPWFVQDPVVLNEDGTWQSTSYIGAPEEASGTPFTICALISDEPLKPGQQLADLPSVGEDSKVCVSVRRTSTPAEASPPPAATSTSLIRKTPPPPGATSKPPIRETVPPTIVASPVGTPSVRITYPQDGDRVELETAVSGNYSGLQPGRTPYLYVLIKPLPENPEIGWFVQNPVVLNPDGTWQNACYIGLPEDVPGTPFKICAVISSELLLPNQQLAQPPQGPIHCISVSRGP